MRHVVKQESDQTDKLRLAQQSLVPAELLADKSLIKSSIYRDPYNTPDGKASHVEDQLAISYHNKCAYCERLCKADIEHYRPKKAVTHEVHEGYYWLCYEWTNLIPSCITCNREGGKHSQFPIIGQRVTAPVMLENGHLDLDKCKANTFPLTAERPYLLHPEIDSPQDYFAFDVENNNIRIKGIDVNQRGEKTISICNLNRVEIRLDRKKNVIDDFIDGVRGAYGRYARSSDTEKLLNELEAAIDKLIQKSHNKENTHTLLRQYIVKNETNFRQIVGPFLPEAQQALIFTIFAALNG